MNQNQIEILQRALVREKKARKAAERILEEKSRELFEASQKLKQLLDEKSIQLQGVFENIIDAYVIMSINGNVLKFNDAATLLFGYDIDKESINVMNLIHKKDREYALSSFLVLQTKGFLKNFETRILTKSGVIKWVEVNGSIIFDKNHKAVAAQGIVRDITDIRNLENQKEKLLNDLKKSNDELQEYAHIVSHDLKSPLRSIDALVSWIKSDNEGKLDEITIQNFDLIENTLVNMEQLISSILEYSSIGISNENEIKINLNSLIENIKNNLFIPKNISFNVASNLPTVKGTKIKFYQLFQNLIANAIKFNDKKKGIIELDFKEENSFYQFSIKDNGMGIDEKFHDKIFKIFHYLNKTKESSGIGLSIVKKIVNLYGGDIWLESEVGKGATFYFTLKK